MFPLQVVINLSNPGVDHTGGEFVLLEQRLRAQSRGSAFLLPQGHGYVFTTRDRPVKSTVRGTGTTRDLHRSIWPTIHPGARLPRRGMKTYTLLDAHR